MNHNRLIDLNPFIGVLSSSIEKLIKIFLITLIITSSNAKPYKSHRCLDWNFGGWSPMLYSLQPAISEAIYHRPSPPPHQTEIHQLSSANYVKKLRNPTQSWLPFYQFASESITPIDDKRQPKVIRYNLRKPSNGGKNGGKKYPSHYLPTTVLHLKKSNYKKNPLHQTKLNVYSVPIKPLSIKNIYTQPIIYEQLDYQLSNDYFNKKPIIDYNLQTPAIRPFKSSKKPQQQQQQQQKQKTIPYPIGSIIHHKQQIIHRPTIVKPKKTTVAAFIPIVQIPTEHIQNTKTDYNQPPPPPPMHLPNLKQQPIKIIEEHVYRVPNHVLHEIRHEIRHEVAPKNVYPSTAYQAPASPPSHKMPPIIHLPPISSVEPKIYDQPQSTPNTYIEIGKPQILYEINNYKSNYNEASHHGGPPIFEIPYQMDNYAKPDDAGLFKQLLDKTRQENKYPKIGAVPYKNDPRNLDVIHLIAHQKHLPMVVPITSIRTNNDNSYSIGQNEPTYPVMEKEISSYSESPSPPQYGQKEPEYNQPPPPQYGQKEPDYNQPPPPQYGQKEPDYNQPPPPQYSQKEPEYNQSPPPPSPQYSQQEPSQYNQNENNYGSKIEQVKNGYVEDEKIVLEQLQDGNKSPAMENAYKEQPQYVVHQTYSQPESTPSNTYNPISSMPDVPLPSAPENSNGQQYQKENNQNYQNTENQAQQVNQKDYQSPPQILKTVYYPAQIKQQEIKTDYQSVEQQPEIKINDYQNLSPPPLPSPPSQSEGQMKEQPIAQIKQYTTEYVKQSQQEEPKQPDQPIIQQIQEEQVKENYPSTPNYGQTKDVHGYGTRLPNLATPNLPVSNYEYIKPTNLPAIEQQYTYQPNTYTQNSYEIHQMNDQKSQNDNQKTVQQQPEQYQQQHQQQYQQQQPVQIKDGSSDEQLNIAAYEEAKRSIFSQPLIYSPQINSYQSSQPQQQYQQQQQPAQNYDDGSYKPQHTYQPPLSTSYELTKANDYTDDYSSSYESNGNYRVETESTKGQEDSKSDKVYDLPSNKAEKVMINNDNYNLKEEILTSEEQTNKKNYESPYDEKASVDNDEKSIKESLKQKTNDNIKFGERIVFVKASKFKNLRMVNGNTYLGDTLLYSASTPTNTTIVRKIDDNVIMSKIENPIIVTNESTPQVNTSSTTTETVDLKIDTTDSNKSLNSTTEEMKSDGIVKPVTRSELRRISKLRKEQDDKLSGELATSASEMIESKFVPTADVINLDDHKESDDLKAEESQLFHAYYGSPDHIPQQGYVRLTIEQFKKIFKNAEIHVLNQDLKLNEFNSSPINSSISDQSSTTSSQTAQT